MQKDSKIEKQPSKKSFSHLVQEFFTYTETTSNIEVSVLPTFLGSESSPKNRIYAFVYTISIKNHSPATVQLIERHWIVSSGGMLFAEVDGEGVIGAKPIIEPSQGFQYSSAVVIKDPSGTMSGEYVFKDSEEKLFEVIIPKFDLIYPGIVH